MHENRNACYPWVHNILIADCLGNSVPMLSHEWGEGVVILKSILSFRVLIGEKKNSRLKFPPTLKKNLLWIDFMRLETY